MVSGPDVMKGWKNKQENISTGALPVDRKFLQGLSATGMMAQGLLLLAQRSTYHIGI
jgi:hypothetical protein